MVDDPFPACLTVQCWRMPPFWNTVFVAVEGLHATFTLGEALGVFGEQAALHLCLQNRATIELATPIAWPLHLQRFPPALAWLSPPLIRWPPDGPAKPHPVSGEV